MFTTASCHKVTHCDDQLYHTVMTDILLNRIRFNKLLSLYGDNSFEVQVINNVNYK